MKRFVISIIILSVIIISSFSLPFYLKATTFELLDNINDISSEIKNNNISNAIYKTNSFIKLWENKKDIICIFVNNKDMNSATYSASKLLPLLKYKDKSSFSSELNFIKSIIISIYEDELPSLKNIF